MLTRNDELLCHQTTTTFDHVQTSAREWTERTWLQLAESSGKHEISLGLGIYPNRNVMDAWACFAVENRVQHTVRASRELRTAPDRLRVGPFSYEVLEPLRKVRVRLDENKYGLAYDLVLEGTYPVHEEEQQHTRYKGRLLEDIARYVQLGRGSGRIQCEGLTVELDPRTCFGARDHSWGIRQTGHSMEAGVEPLPRPPGHFFSFGLLQFDSWAACYHLRERFDGVPTLTSGAILYPLESGKPEVRLTRIEHAFELRPAIRKLAGGGGLVLTRADGQKNEITFRTLNSTCIKTGGYFPYNGWSHGQWMGSEWLDGFKLDLRDPKVLAEASFLDDESVELRCGEEKGLGLIEQVIVGRYPRYGFEGY